MTVIEEEAVAAEAARRPAFVRRFEPVERFAHWWVAFFFAMTVLSGASLGEDWKGTAPPRLILHLVTAGALVAGLALSLVLPGRRALWGTVRGLVRPNQRGGKFNLGQRAAACALAVLLAGIYATGIAAAAAHSSEGGPHGAVVGLTVIVLAGHVFLAVIWPSTRPSLRGMLTGWVDRRWAQRHHPEWVAELERRSAASKAGDAC
jgi:formate dehydrogenase subunit gamma